jgi:ABC-2 type transport system permease protein
MSGADTQIRAEYFSWRRLGAMILRYVYLFRGSWPRLVELCYWPTVQMILWGFITTFFAGHSEWVMQGAGVLISAVLLWDVLFRGELGVTICFLEEMWSRNLGNLCVSPLRPYEFIAALLTMSFIRTFIGLVPAVLLAIPLYNYSIFDLGLPLIAFFANLLVMGWAVGLAIAGILLRWGLGAESLAWLAIFGVAPLSGIYYPISVLPGWLQPVAWALPSAHVFEGMRAVLFDGVFRLDLFFNAVALNVVYIAIGAATFLYFFRVARQRGLILQMGE